MSLILEGTNMGKDSVAKLEGGALDAAVAACLGWRRYNRPDSGWYSWAACGQGENFDWRSQSTETSEIGKFQAGPDWSPSTEWACGGPIIKEVRIYLGYNSQWEAIAYHDYGHEGPEGPHLAYGPTALIAAMRAYVLARQTESS